MKSHAFLIRPAQDVNHPFVQQIPPIRHLVATLVIRSLSQYCSAYVQVTLILFNSGPKVQEE